jgi:hypothetical protein
LAVIFFQSFSFHVLFAFKVSLEGWWSGSSYLPGKYEPISSKSSAAKKKEKFLLRNLLLF